MYPPLNGRQLDALREVTNIGAGRAVDALAQMTGQTVWIEVPEVRLIPFTEVPEALGGPDAPAVGVFFTLSGDLSGALLLLLPLAQAGELVALLTGRPGTEESLRTDLGASAVKEVGNVMAGALLSSLSEFLHLRLIPSIPHMAADLLGAVVDVALADVGQHADQAMVLRTEFRTRRRPIEGHFLLLPDPRSLEAILRSLGTL